MKLWNPALAGMKIGTAKGPIEVGADGSVEVADEDIAEALRRSGFRPEEPENKPKNKPQPRPPVQKKEEKKVEPPKPEPTPEPEQPEEEPEEAEDEEEEEVEVEDLADYSVKDAISMIAEENDADVLEAWIDSESANKKRKTLIRSLKNRLSEVEGG